MPTPLLPLTPHLPNRPGWACRHCECLWPCVDAKGDLGVEFEGRPALLFYYMAAQMVAFVEDFGATGELPTPDVTYPRFIYWIRPATARVA